MKHLLSKLKSGLQKTRRQLSDNVERVLAGRTKVDEELLEELEEVLIGGDVGVSTAEKLIRRLRERIREEKIDTGEAVGEALRQEIGSVLRRGEAEEPPHGEGPRVVLVVGVNGTGKTTTLGKLAHRYRSGGKRVLVAAADTFRAAAVDQLRVWADRAGAEIVANAAGADPAAVAFDAVCAARSRGMDIVLVDTAGRLQTKVNLMEELGKIGRVVGKALPGAPHEVLLVLDATTGQNAVRQAQQFGEVVAVTGLVLTKVDGTAKGGVVVAISDQLGIPVQFLGLGEAMEDLEPFDAEAFASALFEEEATGPAGAEIPS
jgi:fused signal recognition particle receptor